MSELMPYLRVDILGAEDLGNYLASLDRGMQRGYCQPALKAGAQPIAAAIRESDEYRDQTGLLRSSMQVAPGKGDRKGITSMLITFNTTVQGYLDRGVSSAGQKAKLQDRLIYKYSGDTSAAYRVFYARMVEFGHKASGWYADDANAHDVPAHPFGRTGFDATVDTAADVVEQTLMDQIESA